MFLVLSLRVISNKRVSNPFAKPINFQNTSNNNIEIAILFSIVEQSSNYVFRGIEYFQPPVVFVPPHIVFVSGKIWIFRGGVFRREGRSPWGSFCEEKICVNNLLTAVVYFLRWGVFRKYFPEWDIFRGGVFSGIGVVRGGKH